MNKQEFLESYQKIAEELQEQNELLQMVECSYIKAISYDGMPKGTNSFDLSDRLIRIEKIKDKIRRLEVKQARLKDSIQRTAKNKMNILESKVFLMYYIDGYSLRDISKKLNISYGYTKNLNSKAYKKYPYNEKGQA